MGQPVREQPSDDATGCGETGDAVGRLRQSASDVRDAGLDAPSAPTVYANSIQRPNWWQVSNQSYVLRGQGTTTTLIPAMREAVLALVAMKEALEGPARMLLDVYGARREAPDAVIMRRLAYHELQLVSQS